jgi:hypothetical protein
VRRSGARAAAKRAASPAGELPVAREAAQRIDRRRPQQGLEGHAAAAGERHQGAQRRGPVRAGVEQQRRRAQVDGRERRVERVEVQPTAHAQPHRPRAAGQVGRQRLCGLVGPRHLAQHPHVPPGAPPIGRAGAAREGRGVRRARRRRRLDAQRRHHQPLERPPIEAVDRPAAQHLLRGRAPGGGVGRREARRQVEGVEIHGLLLHGAFTRPLGRRTQ